LRGAALGWFKGCGLQHLRDGKNQPAFLKECLEEGGKNLEKNQLKTQGPEDYSVIGSGEKEGLPSTAGAKGGGQVTKGASGMGELTMV